MKKFFRSLGLLSLAMMSLQGFSSENSTVDSNIELILKEKRNHLGDLLVKRFALVKKIAHHKWNLKLPIDDEKEESQYLKELLTQAKDFNLSLDLVETFFSSQIEAQKAIEIQLFEDWVNQGVHQHSLNTQLQDLQQELKETDLALLKNLQSSEGLISKNHQTHMKDLAMQLKEKGYARDVIDDSLHFMNTPSSEQ